MLLWNEESHTDEGLREDMVWASLVECSVDEGDQSIRNRYVRTFETGKPVGLCLYNGFGCSKVLAISRPAHVETVNDEDNETRRRRQWKRGRNKKTLGNALALGTTLSRRRSFPHVKISARRAPSICLSLFAASPTGPKDRRRRKVGSVQFRVVGE